MADFFGNLKKNLTETAEKVAKKTGEVADVVTKKTEQTVEVVKNKVAPPFREAEFDVIYGKGISKSGNILDLGVNLEIVEKSGSWFAYDGTRIGQGRENAKKYIEDNPEVMLEIENKVRAKFNEAFEKSLSEGAETEEDDEEPLDEE